MKFSNFGLLAVIMVLTLFAHTWSAECMDVEQDQCTPRGNYTDCLKHKLLYPCANINIPNCYFNGFEYRVYTNPCIMSMDQQCRDDPFSQVPKSCCGLPDTDTDTDPIPTVL